MACSRANPFFKVAGLTSHILLLTHYDLNREDENLNSSSTMQYFASHMPDTVSIVKTRKWRAQEVARTVSTRSPHRVSCLWTYERRTGNHRYCRRTCRVCSKSSTYIWLQCNGGLRIGEGIGDNCWEIFHSHNFQ